MTTTTPSVRIVRRIDRASLALLVLGLIFGALSYRYMTDHPDASPLLIVPSAVATTLGAANLIKKHVIVR